MGRRPRHRYFLECAKDEALLACDLYNERRRKRNLEAFLVHMSIAWNNLMQAALSQQNISFYQKERNGRFVRSSDGEKVSWSLREMLKFLLPSENNPIRKNIEFFVGLRDKVEHQLTPTGQQALREIVGGKSQAYLRNFEAFLVEHFPADSVATELHLPLFLSALDEEAVKAIKSIRAAVPKTVLSYIDRFENELTDGVKSSNDYDFRIVLVPQVGSKSNADLALQFVDITKLSPEQVEQFQNALVIARDRHVEVANLNRLKPSEVVARIKVSVPMFSLQNHVDAWRYYAVRPPAGANAVEKTKTDAKYCVYDRAHNDYTYSEAWVTKLLTVLASDFQTAMMMWRNGKTVSVSPTVNQLVIEKKNAS